MKPGPKKTAPELCTIEGCGKKYLANGWCSRHNWRNTHYGSPLAGPPERHANAGKTCIAAPLGVKCAKPADRNLLCLQHDQVASRHGGDYNYDTSPTGWINTQGYAGRSYGGVKKLVHRHETERTLGRGLMPHENVHHRDGDKLNNTLGPCVELSVCECVDRHNLELWSTKQPAGQRIEDKVEFAKEIVSLYSDRDDAYRYASAALSVACGAAWVAHGRVSGAGWVNDSGYHANRIDGKTVLMHRVAAECHLGRKLKKNEHIHHRSGDRLDNSIGECFGNRRCNCASRHNLELWSTYQPIGQRVGDKLVWAHEILALYVEPKDLLKYYSEISAKYGNATSNVA